MLFRSVVLLSFAPYAVANMINITQAGAVSMNDDMKFIIVVFFSVIIAVALFGAFIANLFSGLRGAGVPSNLL